MNCWWPISRVAGCKRRQKVTGAPGRLSDLIAPRGGCYLEGGLALSEVFANPSPGLARQRQLPTLGPEATSYSLRRKCWPALLAITLNTTAPRAAVSFANTFGVRIIVV